MKKICVIGSINMDLSAIVERLPKAGETVLGTSFGSYPGGKGANQAIACGRLGAEVGMFGKVGKDSYGEQYIKLFRENRIREGGVHIEEGTTTGTALIEVEATGENRIIVIPGANGKVDVNFIERNYEEISQYDIYLLQLEIPIASVLYVMKRLRAEGKTIILDPAPAVPLPEEVYNYIDYITPNETEIKLLTGKEINSYNDLRKAGEVLLSKGVSHIIAKAGREGAFIISKEEFTHIPGFKVKTVDTTAAGDSFNGGLAYSLSIGMALHESVRFANAVAALSTTSYGAQKAMPTLKEVEYLLLQS